MTANERTPNALNARQAASASDPLADARRTRQQLDRLIDACQSYDWIVIRETIDTIRKDRQP